MAIGPIEGSAVWIVGRMRLTQPDLPGCPCEPQACELVGVFASEAAAEKACHDSAHFVEGPFVVGESVAPESLTKPLSWFPLDGRDNETTH